MNTVVHETPIASLHKRKDEASIAEEMVTQVEIDPGQPVTKGKKTEWIEGSPSYLDMVRATLATLTEEEKDAIHLALQK